MSDLTSGKKPYPGGNVRRPSTTLFNLKSYDIKGFNKIAQQIKLQQESPWFEGVHVIINGTQYNLNYWANLVETLKFIHNLRSKMDYVNRANAKLTIDPTSTTVDGILDYVIDRHCEESIMAHSLELTVVLKEKSTKFHLFEGMDHHEIKAHLEAHKAELGL